MLMYKLWMIPIQYKYFLLLDYVHTGTFSTEAVVYLIYWRYFHLDQCVQGVKTIQGTKTCLKTLENDARVHIAHIALFFN